MASLRCPKCKSANIDLWATGTNIKKVKIKSKTSFNLIPLKPLTLFNTKEKTTVKKRLLLRKRALKVTNCIAIIVEIFGSLDKKIVQIGSP